MNIHTCTCGARYRLPASAFGRSAKCKRCGTTIVLPALATTPRGKKRRDESQDIQPLFVRSEYARFVDETLKALQFPFSLNNLIIFAFVWLLICLKNFLNLGMSYRGAMGVAVLAAWFGAYRVQIVESAAGGEHELPPMSFSHGFADDVLGPFVRWLGSWLVVLWPSVIYAGYLASKGILRPFDLLAMASNGLGGLLRGGVTDQPILCVLIFVGLFFWPVVMLCVAIGDFGCLWRVDLIGKTLFRTFPGYLLVTAIVFGAFLTQSILEREFGSNCIGSAFAVYFEIVACKVIGLYYHCFKSRFAWSWD